MKGFLLTNIMPVVMRLDALGVKKVTHINVQDESKTQYPSVWVKTGFSPESGPEYKNKNKLELKHDNLHSRVPF